MMHRFLFIFLLAIAFGVSLAPAFSADKNQVHVYVVDGDTFHMNGQKIRIWGIDAVELHQTCFQSGEDYACGKSARRYLQSLIGDDLPVCKSKPKSSKETRTVASCLVNGKDVGSEMVKAGWALDYNYFSKGAHSFDEEEARDNKRGIWAGKFQSPYQWRKNH